MSRDRIKHATRDAELDVAQARNSATSDPSATHVAPRDDVERRLTEIWQWVLDIHDLGVRDNFYDLVAAHYKDSRLIDHNSRRALSLFTVIEEEFHRNLPMATLMQTPTIEQLAAVLRAEVSPSSWASLVPIQPAGSKPPFFMIHGGDAHVNFAYHLARQLGPEQPFYGLQAQGLDSKTPPYTRIEDMADLYVRELRGAQPEGPYYLGGRSMGGAIAFEIAHQLLDQGEGVALLVMFDTVSLSLRNRESTRGRDRLNRHISNLNGSRPSEKLSYVLKRVANVARKRKAAMQRSALRTANSFYRGIGIPVPRALQEIRVANQLAHGRYEPRVYPGKVTLLRARQQPGVGTGSRNRLGLDFKKYDEFRDLGWSALAGGGVEVHDVPGNHDDMYYPPHVGELSEKLGACLSKAQASGNTLKLGESA